MKRMLTALALIICLTALAGCRHNVMFARKVRTSGEIKTESYDIRDFTGITIDGIMKDVTLEVRNGDYDVEIEADANYFKELKVDKRGDNLRVSIDEDRKLNDEVHIIVSAPEFANLDLRGAMELQSTGTIKGEDLRIEISGAVETDLDLEYDKVTMNISGAAKTKLYGAAKELSVDCSGAAEVYSLDLKADKVRISMAGAGEAEVNCEEYLEADISGAGSIRYSGDPDVNKDVSGVGSVKHIDD